MLLLESALSAATRASDLAEAGNLDTEMQVEARQLIERLKSQRIAAEETELREARERDMLGRLARLRFVPSEVADEHAWVERENAAAFEAYAGVDLDAVSTDDAVTGLSGGIEESLAIALDHWTWLRLKHRAEDLESAQRLSRIASRLDPDPWRERLRGAISQGDFVMDALNELAFTAGVTRLPPTSIHLLGRALVRVGEPADAVSLYEAAIRKHPDLRRCT